MPLFLIIFAPIFRCQTHKLRMRKIIAYPLYLVHMLLMMVILWVFYPLQVIAYNVLGYTAHKKTVDLMTFLMVYNSYTLFSRPIFKGLRGVPKDKPIIVVSNHQSGYDISPIAWGLRKHHVKYIAKAELGKSKMRSISYNLKKGGSVLIDRQSGSQSIREILKLGRSMEDKNWSACIFPEGTRSRDGKLKEFQSAGFKTLLKASPSALIVPFVIYDNYKLAKWGKYPLNIGLKLRYTALPAISREGYTDDELLAKAKSEIQKALET